jgi:hypothetical protein
VTVRRPDLAEPFHAQLAPVRELVVSVPPPCCGHRKSEDSAFAQQTLIGSRIGLAHFLWSVGDVELDRPTARRLKVYEQQSFVCPDQVAWMRLTMQ